MAGVGKRRVAIVASSDLPEKFSSCTSDQTTYFFYDGKFWMVLYFPTTSVDDNLVSKYPQNFPIDKEWTVSGFGRSYMKGKLYKRGSSNTRIYSVDWNTPADTGSSFIAYIPNYYFNLIRADMNAIGTAEDNKAEAERHKAEGQDKTKIQ